MVERAVKRAKLLIIWIVVPLITICFVLLTAHVVTGQEGSREEIMQELFSQVQKIETLEREEKLLAAEIDQTKQEMETLRISITQEETSYAKEKENLKQVLKSYQRMGAGSYLEIILESNDLTDFLRRLNTLKDLTGNSGKLLNTIQDSMEKQILEKAILTEKLESIQDKQSKLAETITKQKKLKNDLETKLALLAGGNYQESLAEVRKQWDAFKPYFAKTVNDFTSILEAGSFPPDALQLSFSFFSIKGSIKDTTLNEILANEPRLPTMKLSFRPGIAEIQIPEKDLIIWGVFEIQDGQSIRFEAQSGSFCGLPLERTTLKELFTEGDMVISFKSQLGNFRFESIEITNGKLEFTI